MMVFLDEVIKLWLNVAPYLLLGIVIAGVLHIFMGKDFITRHLGKPVGLIRPELLSPEHRSF